MALSLAENGLKGGMSSDEKEIKSASGSMSSDKNGPKGGIISQMKKR